MHFIKLIKINRKSLPREMEFCNIVSMIFSESIIKSVLLNAILHYEFNPIVDELKKSPQKQQSNDTVIS